MLRILIAVFTFFSLVIISDADVVAQQKPCGSEKYKEFDFWLGDWNVYDTKEKLIGTNTIVKMQDDCVLQENWVSKVGPSKGTSYNYYDKTDDSWNQLWVDNSGSSLVLKGKLTEGKMVLKSPLVKNPNGNYFNRITWSKNEDGFVIQVWDYIDIDNNVISEIFRGIYKKQTR